MLRLTMTIALVASHALAQAALAQEGAPESDAPHVVVLTIGGDAPEGVAREAREAVAAALAQNDMRVMSEGDVALRIPPARLRACTAIACAHTIGGELGVATIAAVATWMTEGAPSSVAVSLVVSETRAHTASEEVGEDGLAAAAARAVGGAQDARRRALLVEGSADPERAVRETEEAAVPPPTPTPERPIEQYVLPAIMGALGLVLVGTSIYAFLGEQCFLRGPSGVCLRGDRPNIGLGGIMVTLGGLMVGGAIVWLVLGGDPGGGGPIDVVIGPDGGGLSWHGTF